jgi:hypothetical protein
MDFSIHHWNADVLRANHPCNMGAEMNIFGRMLLAGLLTGIFVYGQTVEAATYYVATTGSDASSGTVANPFRTIAKGLSVMRAGDTLYLRSGTYGEYIRDWSGGVVPSGTSYADAPVIRGYPGEVAVLVGVDLQAAAYVIIQDLVLDAQGAAVDAIAVGNSGAHHVRFINIEAKNSANHVVQISHLGHHIEFLGGRFHDAGNPTSPVTEYPRCYGFYVIGNDNLFDGIEVYNIPSYGIHNYNSILPYPSRNIYRNSVFHHTGLQIVSSSAILLAKGADNAAYNNILYSNNGHGITTGYGDTNTKIYNNTIYGGAQKGIFLSTNAPNGSLSQNAQVINNIVFNNATGAILDLGPTGAGQAVLAANLMLNPLFVNPSGNDFRLQAGSAAIDAGTVLSEVAQDFARVPRPQGPRYDIGAYEFKVISSTPTAPSNLKAF